ncbi:hypothetical protein PF010_g1438 [Phytophthora fragariae]|uniref:C3H1-type domain-containing protein n=1 Tax=Phytophthora fragariae TaxID=53985 RepID=A0A6A3SZW2_9STRA|nr:hypothetical protein PF009_g1805 [Phytophthora fragariae]KAE9028998.1 hypothetical protein PF011_g1303 [Phytophthora fragariae]KAE9121503.1 hypothetical protein PF006_g17889 [Phytophthora fragariae]KAE9137073.1 hypothetical protein PF010_g1438 [Phytophthora fragariae]KAE9137199.1 hypothetical protein PF007_g1869 [Phytophthora fragariae]
MEFCHALTLLLVQQHAAVLPCSFPPQCNDLARNHCGRRCHSHRLDKGRFLFYQIAHQSC